MNTINKIIYAAVVALTFTLAGCPGGGSSGGASTPSTVQITGTVSSPGTGGVGVIASIQPGNSFERMLANLFTSQAEATAIAGTFPVGAGVTVELIEIDNSGAKVGNTIASATTAADGSYTISAPAGFVAATKYVVRATNPANSLYLDAIVTGTSLSVDPGTDLTKSLVIAAASSVGISTVTPEGVAEIQSTVEQLANEADSTAFTNLATTKTLLLAQIAADEAAGNIFSSLSSSGIISGTVTDSSGAPLPNIRIVVRNFGDYVIRAVTRTNASGTYTVHVPAGDYLLLANNRTENSTAASEWWTATGGASNRLGAEKITVATTVTRDFVLDPGVRISGTVTGAISGTPPVRGIGIQIIDFSNDQPVVGDATGLDGKYLFNVRPGTYVVRASNETLQPYATQFYNTSLTGGGKNASEAAKVTLTLGTAQTADFSLLEGRVISGTVTNGVSAVNGMSVRFYTDTGASVMGVRTNKLGNYRLWLRPNVSTSDPYDVRSRGQFLYPDISVASKTGQDFTAAVSEVTTTLNGPTGPVSQAKVLVYDNTAAYNFQGHETSNGDGTVTVYSSVFPVRLAFRIDNGTATASQIYNSTALTTNMLTGSDVSAGNLPSVTLPAGGVLSGVVTVSGNPVGDYLVQVRSSAGGASSYPDNFFVSTRTMIDGSYSISLPVGTYNIRACVPGACSTGGSSITIVAGSNTRDFAL